MNNINNIKNQQHGFVLITVLLFIAALTLITINLSESSLLESKMSNYYAQAKTAFYKTETALSKAESAILNDEKSDTAPFKKIASYCGVDYYRGISSSSHKGATVSLQSTLAKVDSEARCKDPPKVKSGRQSWRIVGVD